MERTTMGSNSRTHSIECGGGGSNGCRGRYTTTINIHKLLLVCSFTLCLSSTWPFPLHALSTPPVVPNGSGSRTYDLVVIGGGSAGLTAAKFAATFGKSVVIVERAALGGDCTWTGCVPSKALIKSAQVAHDVRRAGRFGVVVMGDGDGETTSGVSVDMTRVRDRLRRIQTRIFEEDDSAEALRKLGVDTVQGRATLERGNHVRVVATGTSEGEAARPTEILLRANYGVVLATGAAPVVPNNIHGLDTINYVTYEQIFDLTTVPPALTVVGGGPIGCELAQAFGRLGSKVTLVTDQLLPKEEPLVGETMERVFVQEGITIVKGKITRVSPDQNDPTKHVATVTATAKDHPAAAVTGDLLLLAVGRRPVVQDLGLEQLGVELDADTGGVRVDRRLRVASLQQGNVYAAGDCTGNRQFTHLAGYQGAVAARNVLLPLSDPGIYDDDKVPATTFTSPEVASVGLREQEAVARHGPHRVAVRTQPLSSVDRAECSDEEEGFLQIVYDTKNYRIYGATIVSTAAGEMISEIAVAMKTKLSFDMLATVMHAYPTYSFALQAMAAEVYYEKLVKNKGLYNFLKRLGL